MHAYVAVVVEVLGGQAMRRALLVAVVAVLAVGSLQSTAGACSSLAPLSLADVLDGDGEVASDFGLLRLEGAALVHVNAYAPPVPPLVSASRHYVRTGSWGQDKPASPPLPLGVQRDYLPSSLLGSDCGYERPGVGETQLWVTGSDRDGNSSSFVVAGASGTTLESGEIERVESQLGATLDPRGSVGASVPTAVAWLLTWSIDAAVLAVVILVVVAVWRKKRTHDEI